MPFLILVPGNRHKNLDLTDGATELQVAFSVTNFRYSGYLPLTADRGTDVELGEFLWAESIPIVVLDDASFCLPIDFQNSNTIANLLSGGGDYSLALSKLTLPDPVLMSGGGEYSLAASGLAESIPVVLRQGDDFTLSISVAAPSLPATMSYVGNVYPVDRDTKDPYVNLSNNALLCTFEGTDGSTSFTDAYGKALVAGGTAQIKTAVKKFGLSSAYFSGTGSYISGPTSSPDLAFGTGDFTIEKWVYPTAFGALRSLIDLRQTPAGAGFCVLLETTGKIYIFAAATQYATATKALTLNAWNHIAVVRRGGVLTVFLNGTAVITHALTVNFTESGLLIGAVIDYRDASTNYKFAGYLDSIRITKGIARYTEWFVPPAVDFPLPSATAVTTYTVSDPYFASCQLALDFNTANGFNDTKGHVVTANGTAAISSTTSPFGTQSAYFDGTSYVSVAPSADFTLAASDLTVEGWIYLEAASPNAIVLSTMSGASALNVVFDATGSYLKLTDGTSTFAVSSAISLGTWTHFCVERVSGQSKIAIAGVFGAVVACATSFTQAGLSIGGLSTGQNLNGYLSQLRLAKIARYSANFTPPFTAYLNDDCYANLTQLHLTMDGANGLSNFIDVKGRPVTVIGTVKTDTTDKKFGISSAKFSSGGSLSVPDSADMEFGAGNLTVEAWVKSTAGNAYCTIMTRPAASSFASGAWTLFFNNGNSAGLLTLYVANYSTGGPLIAASTGKVNDGAWHHVAWTRNGNIHTLWFDGVAVGTATWAGTIADIAQPLRIGTDPNFAGRDFVGSMDNVRVTVGVARYVAPFSVANNDPYWNSTILNMPLSDLTTDLKGTTVTSSGTVTALSTQHKAQYPSAAYFDDGLLVLPSGATFEPAGSDLTIEFWYYTDSAARQWFFAASSDFWMGLDLNGVGAGMLGMWASSNGTSWDLLGADTGGNGRGITAMTLGKWNHIAMCRSGNVWSTYINGVLDKTVTVAGSVTNAKSAQSKRIGNHGSINYPVLGYMQDLRWTKGVCRYRANFIPPERLQAA